MKTVPKGNQSASKFVRRLTKLPYTASRLTRKVILCGTHHYRELHYCFKFLQHCSNIAALKIVQHHLKTDPLGVLEPALDVRFREVSCFRGQI